MRLSGFLFLFILVLNLVMGAFGYIHDISDIDSHAELQKINDHPKRFQISIVLAHIEHICVIALAIMLFIVFSSHNIILGIVGITFRIGEGLIQIPNDKNYGRLLNIARQYSGSSGAEKKSLSDLARTILKTKDLRFTFVLIFWSIGTLAFSILFVAYEVVPSFIGWIGIVGSISYGIGEGIKLVKPNFKVLLAISIHLGEFLALILEVILGGWLLFFV